MISMKKTLNFVFEKSMHFGTRTAAAIALGVVAQASHAAIDTTAVTGAITEAGAAVAVVGAAVLVLSVGIAVYKWLKRPIS